jgi:HD superfamily phosphohydrolase
MAGPERQLFPGTHSQRQAGVYFSVRRRFQYHSRLGSAARNGFFLLYRAGRQPDIDVDDLLDYLARDSKTSAILLYLEQLSDARRFVSAARASRNKPILVIKAGAAQPLSVCCT